MKVIHRANIASPVTLEMYQTGKKTLEVRMGEEWARVQPGDHLVFYSPERPDDVAELEVTRVIKATTYQVAIEGLSVDVARLAGFDSAEDLEEALGRFYPESQGPVVLMDLRFISSARERW